MREPSLLDLLVPTLWWFPTQSQQLMGLGAAQPLFPNAKPCRYPSSSTSERKNPFLVDVARIFGDSERLQAQPLTLLPLGSPLDPAAVPPAWAWAPPRGRRPRCQGILLHWQLDLHFLHLGQTSLFTAHCSALCPALLLPPSPPFMYRYFIANTPVFTTGFFTLWPTSPINSFVTFTVSCSWIKITRRARFREPVCVLMRT